MAGGHPASIAGERCWHLTIRGAWATPLPAHCGQSQKRDGAILSTGTPAPVSARACDERNAAKKKERGTCPTTKPSTAPQEAIRHSPIPKPDPPAGVRG